MSMRTRRGCGGPVTGNNARLFDIFAALRPGLTSPEGSAQREELAWQDRGLCAETDPEAFFPEKGGSTAGAKQVCGSCEVRAECLAYALRHDERFGIWGGASERDRRKLRRDFGDDITSAVDRALTTPARRRRATGAAAVRAARHAEKQQKAAA